MDPETVAKLKVYSYEFKVPAKAIDANGHVNNVSYVKWMQDAAIRHWESLGGMEIDEDLNCTWVARSHHIEYLAPGYEGDVIETRTWIDNMRRVRSLRKYEFRRRSDDKLLARGETDWVFVDVDSGRPKPIPDYVSICISAQNR
jgi:acyl-CoA thioester hydrolase